MTFEREFTDEAGNRVRVRVELDEGKKLEREIQRLAGKARHSMGRKSQALGGAFRVVLVHDEAQDGRMP